MRRPVPRPVGFPARPVDRHRRPRIAELLAVWGELRRGLGQKVYVHDIDPCPAHWLPIWHHRLSIPSHPPWLVLCPKGSWRWEPAAWSLPFEERLVDGSGEPSWIDRDKKLQP